MGVRNKHSVCNCSCTVHLQYIPIWAILGLAIMIAGCATFALSVRRLLPCMHLKSAAPCLAALQ